MSVRVVEKQKAAYFSMKTVCYFARTAYLKMNVKGGKTNEHRTIFLISNYSVDNFHSVKCYIFR